MSTLTASPEHFHAAVERCRLQQVAWACLPLSQRLRPVLALRRLLVAECDFLCTAVSHDLAKTKEETLAGDILPLADACKFLEREAARLLRPRRVPLRQRPLWLWGQSDTVFRRPRGIIGLIGTWNYPLFINGVPLLQALSAGNGVLWKPSEVAPASAAALYDLLLRAGYPADLVQLLPATREAGKELAEAAVDHVVFVGSSTTGRLLANTLSRRLVGSTLELSGCDAMFILDDADIQLAARAAWFGATINRGQTCIAVRRVFVPRLLYESFTEALRPLAAAARPLRLLLPGQVEQAERLVHEAVAKGARLLPCRETTGQVGNPLDDSLFTPVIILDARPEMALCREALFAPLLAVLPYDTLEEALRMDASCPYGLAASIFTRDQARGSMVATRLRTGMVAINDVVVPTAHPATPFGGRGESGWGVTQGEEGLLEMTIAQVVSVRKGNFRPHYDLGTGVDQGNFARALLESQHAGAWRQRWRGWIRLAAALWQMRGKRNQ